MIKRVQDLLDHAAADRDRVGWLAGDRAVRFADMDALSDRIAVGLLKRGVHRGDRVAINIPNTPEWAAVYFALAKIGAILVGLSVRYRETELAHILGDSGARLVITVPSRDGADFMAMLARLRDRLPALETVVTLDDSGECTLGQLDATPVDAQLLAEAEAMVRPDDPVMIIYTSGTTGTPKGAVLTHQGQLGAATAQAQHMQIDDSDILPLAVPLNHVGGITCCLLAALTVGARVVLLETFTAAKVLELLRSGSLTVWVGVPTMHTLLLNHPQFGAVDTSAVRLVVSGGANAEPVLVHRLISAFPNATVMNLYGLSEVSGAAIMTPWRSDTDTTALSIGEPLRGVEVRIADARGAEVAVGETGELHLRTPSMMAGYHAMPSETTDVIDSDGWLRTSDLACVDSRGSVFMRGRVAEMFVQGGFNIYPIEVENILTAHPDVVMAAGIGVPDPVLGEIGRYYVTLAPNARIDGSDLREFCAARIADYKVPKQIVIREQLPMTPSGKVHKHRLRSIES
ncbi:class I adenylate-forming enzyme family protein [Nocardia nova]|uniref:class I adenylate-forming enzyme family protein n=1 Tax=Nocardia nova TaxID=37330 RepID=UPI0033E50FE0